MKTSLTETKQIEAYLLQPAGEDTPVFEARLILEPGLHEKLLWQQKTYALLHRFGHRQLRAELEAVHQKLFREAEHRTFREKILQLFTKS
jgi:hypothetical protein